MSWLKKYRTSRGFGVHSPFAFRFILETLREKLPYYAYSELTDKCDRLLFRVASRFNPKSYTVLGEANPKGLITACPSAINDSDNPELVIVGANNGENVDFDNLGHYIENRAVIFCHDADHQISDEIAQRLEQIGCGMTFSNSSSCLIAVPRADLPRQDFKLFF